jgi:hypothetical protein
VLYVITDFHRKSSLLALHVWRSYKDYSGNLQWWGNVTCQFFLMYFGRFLLLLQRCLSSDLSFVFFSTIYLTFCSLFSGQQSFLCSRTIPQIFFPASYVVNICDFYGLCLGFKFRYHLLVDAVSYQVLRSISCSWRPVTKIIVSGDYVLVVC